METLEVHSLDAPAVNGSAEFLFYVSTLYIGIHCGVRWTRRTKGHRNRDKSSPPEFCDRAGQGQDSGFVAGELVRGRHRQDDLTEGATSIGHETKITDESPVWRPERHRVLSPEQRAGRRAWMRGHESLLRPRLLPVSYRDCTNTPFDGRESHEAASYRQKYSTTGARFRRCTYIKKPIHKDLRTNLHETRRLEKR